MAVEKELKSVVSSLVTTSEQASKTTATEAGKVVICHTPLQVLTIAVHVYLLSNCHKRSFANEILSKLTTKTTKLHFSKFIHTYMVCAG